MRCADLLALIVALALAGCAPEPVKHAPVRPQKAVAKPATKPAVAAKPAAAKPAPTAPRTPAPKPPVQAAAAPAPVAAAPAPPPAPKPEPPRSPQERYSQALAQVKASRWQDAEAALGTSVRDYPQQSGPHTNLGIVYARTNRRQQAVVEFSKAVAANARNAVAHNWLGVLAREAGDHGRAELEYRAALNADAAYAPAQLNLAILYDDYLKRPADALAAYRRYQALAGKTDPRAAVWVAQLEARGKPQGATP
jgi:tetratricopeptide (TPR) repeat protein